ncbi:MAG: hypothetical protein AUI85_09445 [Acidobacteriales bacterium 13_1_40CM_3_55_5]|nr:MAG: hypothetical protein AUI85_09445 [Acidobacteriales bacterium 13_1_40CM_3_55_5]
MIGYLNEIVDRDWRPVSRWALGAWLIFYGWFLIYAFTQGHGYLFIDSANLVVHEAGHLLFGWLGPTLGLWGGTILQWLVPLLLAAYFFVQRQTTAFAFCMFLPLVTVGDPEFAEHDWHAIFSSLGVLQYDTRIAWTVRMLGWCGMFGTVLWLMLQSLVNGGPQGGACKFDHLPRKCYKD